MTLKEYLTKTEFGKCDKIGIRDHAGNILVDITTQSKIPKKYYRLNIKKGFVHETMWCGARCPSVHELWLETIDHDLIEEREKVAKAFYTFIHSFPDYEAEQVAILCRELLKENSEGTATCKIIGVPMGLRYLLPEVMPDKKLVEVD